MEGINMANETIRIRQLSSVRLLGGRPGEESRTIRGLCFSQ